MYLKFYVYGKDSDDISHKGRRQPPWVGVCTILGLHLLEDIMFESGRGFDLVKMMEIKRYIHHFRLSQAIPVSQGKRYF
jgi:hypothetical protein